MAEQKRLTRSSSDRMVCGVAAGLAEYLNVDPVLVRLGFVLAALAGNGLGLLVYVVLCVVMPEKGTQTPTRAADNGSPASSEPEFEPLGSRE